MIWRGVRRRRILFWEWKWSDFFSMVDPLCLIHPGTWLGNILFFGTEITADVSNPLTSSERVKFFHSGLDVNGVTAPHNDTIAGIA